MSAQTGTVSLRIRPGMDVYSTYQNQYLGTVIAVTRRAAPREPVATPKGGRAPGSEVLGEALGPVPTDEVGNTGPRAQSAANAYATRLGPVPADVVAFVVRPGRANPRARPLYVPTAAVRSISMERIILDVQREAIPDAWQQPIAGG